MIHEKRVIVVLPAYNAEATLQKTYDEIPQDVVDEIILVDDHSQDKTAQLAVKLGIKIETHANNLGYGGNQKTCYRLALEAGADIVVMVHPDYQYSPKLITAMASMIASGHFDVVLGSRIFGRGAPPGGMPLSKYISHLFLPLVENWLLGAKLSEYHTGYRAYSREVLLKLPLKENSDDFIFDNQILAQVLFWGFSIGEISCPTRYFPEASSINFSRSCAYGLGVLYTGLSYRLQKLGWLNSKIFSEEGERL